jgi:hypothetical protein
MVMHAHRARLGAAPAPAAAPAPLSRPHDAAARASHGEAAVERGACNLGGRALSIRNDRSEALCIDHELAHLWGGWGAVVSTRMLGGFALGALAVVHQCANCSQRRWNMS